MCYKVIGFCALLLTSLTLFGANDPFISILPTRTFKVSEGVYEAKRSFQETLRRMRKRFDQNQFVKNDLIINEDGFRVAVFFNLKETSRWQKIYVIERDEKVFIRVIK